LVAQHRKNSREVRYLRWEFAVGEKVAHPRLVKMFQFGTDKGIPYLAMEWLTGRNMKQIVTQGVEKIGHLVPDIVAEAAEGLAHFNAMGYVHRDIKPHNFIVSDAGEVKLIDFALARKSRGGLAKLFAPKTKLQGTRSYMAPEQIRGAVVDQRADLYSFACTIYELLAGTPPFTGSSANDLLNKHLRAPIPSLEAANDNITSEFAQLLRRALAKSPADRLESVSEFLKEMQSLRIYKQTPEAPTVAQS